MDIQKIIEKAVEGEDISALTETFTEEQKKNLDLDIAKAAKLKKEEELNALTALRKEKNRVNDLAKGSDPEEMRKKIAEETVIKFRNEQLDKAKSKFFSDPRFTLTDADKASFEEEFKKLDTGKVDSDLIFKDLVRTYTLIKGDELLAAREKGAEMQKNAEYFKASAASVTSQLSTPEAQKYSEKARELFKAWGKAGVTNKTLDDAERIVNSGMSRVL